MLNTSEVETYPAARWRFGLYERAELVGVAVFSVPVRAEALRPLPLDAATELGRLVLLDAAAVLRHAVTEAAKVVTEKTGVPLIEGSPEA